jgi:DNA gyrase subunit A
MPQNIQPVDIAEEARSRMLRYMVSVVRGRALPDVRDGLKPVQRRILYAMYHDLSLTADKKPLKCAKIVGDVMGNYHPHGDGALYEALVRMTQEWVLRVPLVDGQGNFGSVDGDPPAAYRYTEARLTKAAELLLSEIDQDTIDKVASYDGTKQEPVVLPAQFPNLLVNGTQGIAVGLATNVPPHNLGEVLRACVLLIDNPDATVAQLMDKVKGPDFPLGGKIVGDRATMRKIFEEGRGSIKLQGEWVVEDLGRGRQQVVVTSIPYGVVKGTLEEAIGAIIESKKLPQLVGSANESNDKDGLRLVLELKPGADPNLVMAYLYKHTELQKTISYNVTCLVPADDGTTLVPRDGLSLRDLLRHFLAFRLAVVRRRLQFQLRQLRRRIHLLDGFRVVFDGLDRAIKLIRSSTGKPDAAQRLMAEFPLDEEQTAAVLDSQLYKLATLEIQRILDELREKQAEAARLEALLASEARLWGVVRGELEALAGQPFVARRRTRMATDEDVLAFDEQAYIVRENTNVVLTRDGWLKRVGRLASVETTRVRDGDAVTAVVPASTLDTAVFFADDGTAYTMPVNDIPASSGYGEPITKFVKLADRVRVIAAVTTDPRFVPADTAAGPLVFVATSGGNCLRLPLANFRAASTKAGRRFVKLDDGDTVTLVRLVGDETGAMLATRRGHVIHFRLDEVGVLSGAGKGVMGVKLGPDDVCLGGTLVTEGRRSPGNRLVVETESGKTQEFTPEGLKAQGRGGSGQKQGVRTTFARVVPPPIELADWDAVDAGRPARKPDAGDLPGM